MRKLLCFVAALLVGCSSSTTTPSPVAPAPVAAISPTVGFIGCSNTWMSVAGYHMVSGNLGRFWPKYSTGSGTVQAWADPTSNFWTLYKQMVATYGQPQKVWVQLCESFNLGGATDYAHVKAMLANLRAASPNAQPYVSAINQYNPAAGLCSAMGPTGAGETDTQAWAAQAVADGLAKAGPAMGPLTAALLQSDGCHPTNPQGATFLGGQLARFFDQ